MSRNIELTNQAAIVDTTNRYSTLDPYIHQKQEKLNILHKRVNT